MIDGKPCNFIRFGLIVTGKGEQKHLPKLFGSLMALGICTFEVIRFVGQRPPLSEKKQLKMTGTNKLIPDEDQNQIGLPARGFLNSKEGSFVIVIDDLEYDRREQIQQIFERYRRALDTILLHHKYRASVHFLVFMLEAYYFADSSAVNSALGQRVLTEDYPEDVETIRHPKNELIKLYPAFREVDDGGKILERIDTKHVLVRSETCGSLRSLFRWSVQVMEAYLDNFVPITDYCLNTGILNPITAVQAAII